MYIYKLTSRGGIKCKRSAVIEKPVPSRNSLEDGDHDPKGAARSIALITDIMKIIYHIGKYLALQVGRSPYWRIIKIST